jgi:arylsulfatase A-like enzyme
MKNRQANQESNQKREIDRRELLKTGGLIAAGVLGSSGRASARRTASNAPGSKKTRPNFLFIISDQLGLDALSAHGCTDVHTPNIDRLIRSGVSFMESHSTSPVCSPARSSLFTGRMPVETGVIGNNRPIRATCPNMGQWFRRAGYETAYCGKWHLPGGYPAEIPGFDVLPVGQGQGDLVDTVVSRSCEAYLKNRNSGKPFLLVASLMQPHDICYWAIQNRQLVPKELPFPQLAGRLPELPANHKTLPPAPKRVNQVRFKQFTTEEQWRYYIYIYYRQVEMLDADVGRILRALEASGKAKNTIVVLTSDHGEGRGRHQNVQKWHPYDESMKVPMLISFPGKMREGHIDTTHLVSGLDVMSTMVDYAGIKPPADVRGKSLRPLLEGKETQWREFLGADCHQTGRIIRTADYKYVKYPGDPVEQLFHMKNDPWETTNLYDEAKYVDILRNHRRLLREWEAHLTPAPPTRDFSPKRKNKS